MINEMIMLLDTEAYIFYVSYPNKIEKLIERLCLLVNNKRSAYGTTVG